MKITRDSRSDTLFSGTPLNEASAVMILLHGRGSSAEDILSLTDVLGIDNITYAAPQAQGNTWYPYSFLEPVERNEPYLSSSLEIINILTDKILSSGVPYHKLFYLGFSQGACLALEYCARNPKKYGGIFGLSGGLIGKENSSFDYEGNLEDTSIFLGCSNIDPHIPLERVDLTEKIFGELKGDVTKRIYNNFGHAINQDEIEFVRNSLKSSI